jgi:hypothetical protein
MGSAGLPTPPTLFAIEWAAGGDYPATRVSTRKRHGLLAI